MHHLQPAPQQPKPQLSPLLRSVNASALILSGILAFLLAPYFADITQGSIASLVAGGWGEQWVHAAKIGWRVMSIPLLFFILWLIWTGLFLTLILKLSTRLFR